MKRLMNFVVLAFVSVLIVVPSPAASQDVQALLDRIERLERDIRTLNTQISRGDDAVVETGTDSNLPVGATLSGTGVARIDSRITALENDVRSATGAFEDLDHRIFELTTTLEKLVGDVDFRLSELEQKLGGGAMSSVPSQTPQVSTVAPAGTVTQVMTQSTNNVLGTITGTELMKSVDTAEAPATAAEQVTTTQTLTTPAITQSESGVESSLRFAASGQV